MVTTTKIKLSQLEYFKILLILYLKRRWWVLLMVFAIVFMVDNNASSFYIIFAIVYPVMICFQLWRYVTSPENKGFFAEAQHEIDTVEFRSYLTDGSESILKLPVFVKLKEINNNYLLYISAHQFITVPKSAFNDEDDRTRFYNFVMSGMIR